MNEEKIQNVIHAVGNACCKAAEVNLDMLSIEAIVMSARKYLAQDPISGDDPDSDIGQFSLVCYLLQNVIGRLIEGPKEGNAKG